MRLRNVWVGRPRSGARGVGRRVRRRLEVEARRRFLDAGGARAAARARRSTPRRPANVTGAVTLEGTAPKNEADQDERRSGLRARRPRARRCRKPSSSAATASRSATSSSTSRTASATTCYDAPTDRPRSTRRAAATLRTCSASGSASRSRSSTAIRRCTTSTRCRRRTASSTTASRSRA